MKYTGFKFPLCCKNIGMKLPSFVCISSVAGNGGRKRFQKIPAERLRESPSFMSQFFVEYQSYFCVIVCLGMCAWHSNHLLSVTCAVNMTDGQMYKVCNDKGVFYVLLPPVQQDK